MEGRNLDFPGFLEERFLCRVVGSYLDFAYLCARSVSGCHLSWSIPANPDIGGNRRRAGDIDSVCRKLEPFLKDL